MLLFYCGTRPGDGGINGFSSYPSLARLFLSPQNHLEHCRFITDEGSPRDTCTCFAATAHQPPDEWWMNVNVIKQFSVYLKLQTFTLSTPSRGRQKKTKTYRNYFSNPTTAMRQCQENCFSFPLTVCLLRRDPVASEAFFMSQDFMCMSISLIFFSGLKFMLLVSRFGEVFRAGGELCGIGTREALTRLSSEWCELNKSTLNYSDPRQTLTNSSTHTDSFFHPVIHSAKTAPGRRWKEAKRAEKNDLIIDATWINDIWIQMNL